MSRFMSVEKKATAQPTLDSTLYQLTGYKISLAAHCVQEFFSRARFYQLTVYKISLPAHCVQDFFNSGELQCMCIRCGF